MSTVATDSKTTLQSISDLERRVGEIDCNLDSQKSTEEYVTQTILLQQAEYEEPGGTKREREAAKARHFDAEFKRMKHVYNSLLQDPNVSVAENDTVFAKERGRLNPYYCAKVYCEINGENVIISF